MAEKKGLIQRFIVGKDRDEHYARSTLPSNRKELLWDIIKGRFWKLVLMNLMLIIAFLPLILVMLMQSGVSSSYSSMLPFSGGLFAGYPFIPDLYQLMFLFEFNVQIQMLLLFLPAIMFSGLILSGIFVRGVHLQYRPNRPAVISFACISEGNKHLRFCPGFGNRYFFYYLQPGIGINRTG